MRVLLGPTRLHRPPRHLLPSIFSPPLAMSPSPLFFVFFFFFFFFLFFLLLLTPFSFSLPTDNPSSSSLSSSCDGRRIHIRRLPSRFNTGLLLNCSPSLHPFLPSSPCFHIANAGLGPKTHNLSFSWYRTDHRLLEPFFHRRLLEYPCLTSDPSISDAIFLPYYASFDALRFLHGLDYNLSSFHGLDLQSFLQDNDGGVWARRGGNDHFLVVAGPAWDFSQSPDAEPPVWGTSLLELPGFLNITALTLESRPRPWQEQAVPYPTSFHPANLARLDSWIARVRRSRRTNLILFAGSGGGGATRPGSPPNIRRSIREECGNMTYLCEYVDCSEGKCDHNPIRFMVPMLRSKFCLHPPGDTPTRRGIFDGILAGCIPVFFEDLSAKKQYGWHLPEDEYDKFSVTIPKEDVVFGGVKVAELLMAISKEEVARMRERVLELIPKVMYRRHGASVGLRAKKDAFDIAVEGVLRRIKERSKGLEQS